MGFGLGKTCLNINQKNVAHCVYAVLTECVRLDCQKSIKIITSTSIGADLEQLLRLMLFGRAINNTDDHERNFSVVNAGEDCRLLMTWSRVCRGGGIKRLAMHLGLIPPLRVKRWS
jgi:hypothetical protein